MKEGWDKSRERFAAWWHGQAVDRVLLQVIAPANDPPASDPVGPLSLEEKWLDVDRRIRHFEDSLERTFYGGDAFPYLETHLGPGTLSTFLGAVPEFRPDTVWYRPVIADITQAEPPEYGPDNRFWQFTREICTEGVRRLEGRALVSIPDLIEGLDTLCSLIGTEQLLYALQDQPDDVHRFQDALTELYFDYYDPIYNIVRDEHDGSCFSVFNTYGEGTVSKLQCDVSAMISPEMFEEFAAPYLQEQCERLDYTVYHLDGPDALQHLDTLLSIPDLNAIQWTPGAGQEPATSERWLPMYRTTRKAGKSLMIRGGSPEEARRLVEALGPEGLDITLWMSTQSEAEAVLADCWNWRKL